MKNKNVKMIRLNLGSGQKYLKGYINCDYSPNVEKDKFLDLNKFPYPFKASSVDEILMDNVLEHVDNVVKVMEELYRILRNNGKLIVKVPYGHSDGAMQDPTHKNFFTEKTMDYFTYDSEFKFYSSAKFKKIRVRLYAYDVSILNKMRNLIPFRNKLRFLLLNMYDAIDFELHAVK